LDGNGSSFGRDAPPLPGGGFGVSLSFSPSSLDDAAAAAAGLVGEEGACQAAPRAMDTLSAIPKASVSFLRTPG
jgi:hypothetical protein